MREIKFRAWNPYDRMMIYVTNDSEMTATKPSYELDLWGDGWEMVEITAAGKRIVCANVTKTKETGGTLMQSTSLKDKNGVEIYEGDVVSAEDLICEVKWSDIHCGFVAKWTKDRSGDSYSGEPPLGWRKHAVLGNIYENPELLNKD